MNKEKFKIPTQLWFVLRRWVLNFFLFHDEQNGAVDLFHSDPIQFQTFGPLVSMGELDE